MVCWNGVLKLSKIPSGDFCFFEFHRVWAFNFCENENLPTCHFSVMSHGLASDFQHLNDKFGKSLLSKIQHILLTQPN